MDAEAAYVFRHALLREVAMQLQPPTERAALHGAAFAILENHYSAQADPAVLDAGAAELALHARLASAQEGALPAATQQHLQRKELFFAARAAAAAQRAFHHAEAMTWNQRVAEHPLATPAQAVAALLDAAGACSRVARLSEAAMLQRQALALAQQHALHAEIARAARELATSHAASGKDGEAAALMNTAVAAARAAGNDDVLGATLLASARSETRSSNVAGREALLAEADALLARTGNLAGRASILSVLASNEHDRSGDTRRCVELHTAAMQLARQAGARELEASILVSIGVTHANGSQATEAEAAYRQALQVATEIGNRRYRATLLHNLAQLERFFHGRPMAAAQLYEEAAEEFREMEQLDSERSERLALTNLLVNMEAFGRAEAQHERAAEIARLAGNAEWAAGADRSLAALRLAQGRLPEAEAAARRALMVRTGQGPTGGTAAICYDVLADVAWQQGRLQAAQDLLAAAVADCLGGPAHTVAWGYRHARMRQRLLLADKPGALEDYAAIRASYGEGGEAGLPLVHVFLRVLQPQLALSLAEADEFTHQHALALVARMREVLGTGDLMQYPARRRALERAENALAELTRAQAEGRQPRLFRGALPRSLPPVLRLALLQHQRHHLPEEQRRMLADDPALMQAMREGTEGLKAPDWSAPAVL